MNSFDVFAIQQWQMKQWQQQERAGLLSISSKKWPEVLEFIPPYPHNSLRILYYPRQGILVVGEQQIFETEHWHSMYVTEPIHPDAISQLVIKHGFDESRIAFVAGTPRQNVEAARKLMAWLQNRRKQYPRDIIFDQTPSDPRIDWRVRELQRGWQAQPQVGQQ